MPSLGAFHLLDPRSVVVADVLRPERIVPADSGQDGFEDCAGVRWLLAEKEQGDVVDHETRGG